MKKFLKLTGSFLGSAIIVGGQNFIQSGNPIHAAVAGIVGGVIGAGFHATKSPLSQTFDLTKNEVEVKPDVKIQVDPKE